jgi:hypothetical protein
MRVDENIIYKLLKSKSIDKGFDFPVDASSADFNIDRPFENHRTTIFNAREISSPPTLCREGFCLLSGDIAFDNVYSEEKLNNDSQLIQTILEKHTHAKACIPLGHIIRDETSKADQPLVNRPPAAFVHADWSPDRIRDLPNHLDTSIITNKEVSIERINQLINNAKHWVIYNAWTPLKTVVNTPLALCDASTVECADIIKYVRFKNPYQSDTKIMIMSLKYKPLHRWLYYPLMQSNELLVFRQFDSKQGINNFIPVFHTAFKILDNQKIKSNVRESIEFRFLVSL